LRKLVVFVGATTFVNIVIGSQLTYRAVTFMETVSFCGQTCHTVMKPEFTAYQNSPHSRVECVACHIGAGASWFVKSKLSGVRQVFAVAFNTYPRPIPTPVHNLRPARETCEACHWPQKYGEDRLRVVEKFADDEPNTRTKTVLLMRIGGGRGVRAGAPGIHGAHLGPGIRIEYLHTDEARQSIPQVEYHNARAKRSAVYVAADAKPEALKAASRRVMDCMDCHNRPTHTLDLPERAIDRAMAAGEISPTLPFVKKQGLEILKRSYATNEQAAAHIPEAVEAYYKASHPEVFAQRRAEVRRAGTVLAGIYNRNVFPEMKVNWGTYPNNIGHTDFPGCFRCHDDNHAAAGGQKITQDYNACHQLLAMDENAPKILTELGLSGAGK
jgi:nitrate/TMAO reductase-like tetraheme cytochrome c subunit